MKGQIRRDSSIDDHLARRRVRIARALPGPLLWVGGKETSAITSRQAQTKTPRAFARGVFDKPGDTYFRECSHYHRPEVLNYCVRNGNRCFHYGMVARKDRRSGKTPSGLTFWLFEQERH